MRSLLEDSAERAIQYLESLPDRKVLADPEALEALSRLVKDGPSEEPVAAEAVLEMLDQVCSPASIATAGPRFFGFVVGGSLPASLAANWLAGAWDQNAAFYNVTPAMAILEKSALDWLVKLFHLPEGTGGSFVTGATMANFTALAAARHSVLERVGWNVEAQGLFDAPPISIIISEEGHPTLYKSLGLLGLGRNRVLRVTADEQGRMCPEALPPITGPAIVVAQAGNVNTGAFDPFKEICEHAHEKGAWVHVDGAFGLWAAATPGLANLTEGLNLADSWATDGHKWLNVPYDSGLAFVRDPRALQAAMAITADYLPTDSTERNPSDFTPELSRRARGVEVWAALKSLGRKGIIELIERSCRQAGRFAQGLQEAGYEILNQVVLNQVLVSFGEPETTRKVIAAIQKDGTCWCGGTVWQGKTAMRISLCNWMTTEDDVEMSLKAMVRLARRVAGTRSA